MLTFKQLLENQRLEYTKDSKGFYNVRAISNMQFGQLLTELNASGINYRLSNSTMLFTGHKVRTSLATCITDKDTNDTMSLIIYANL